MTAHPSWTPFDWSNKTVIVTGGAGFLGRHLVAALRARGLADQQIVVPRKANYDLRSWDAVQQLFSDFRRSPFILHPSSFIVIHLAGNVGGIPLRFATGRLRTRLQPRPPRRAVLRQRGDGHPSHGGRTATGRRQSGIRRRILTLWKTTFGPRPKRLVEQLSI